MDEIEQSAAGSHDELIRSLKRHEDFLNRQLEVYRSQRAWRLMLLVRKLYTLLVREAPSHPVAALRRLITDPLSLYDIDLPAVWDFLPAGGIVPPLPAPGQARYSLIVLPVFDFEMRFARPQQIAAQFAASGHTVYWVSPTRGPSPDANHGFEIAPLRRNLHEVRLAAPPYHLNLDELTPELLEALAVSMEAMIRDQGVGECWLMVQFPFWRKLALRLRQRFGYPIFYDCMDDHQNWPLDPKPSPANSADERELFAEADVVTVTAEGLGRQARRFGAGPILLPNGADTALYESAGGESEISGLPRPVIGFIGGVEQWFDVDAVAHAAAARPGYSFVIVGRVGKGVDRARLDALPNVHLLGEKKYALLPSIQRNFDVCLIPFLMHPLMEFANQVKLYEYFSQGKPVVSSRLPELQAPPELIYFAGTSQEYLAQIDAALAESRVEARSESGPSLAQRRIDFARSTNWVARTASMDQAIRARTPLVSVIVLTYNSERYLAPFHRYFLRNTAWPNWELIYADNASTDSTRALLDGFAGKRVHTALFGENLGFAGGNNAAAHLAQGDYLIFLNPDTIVTHCWTGRLVRALETHPGAGLAAPLTNFSGKRNRIDTSYTNCAAMESFAAQLARDKRHETGEIPVAPMLCAALKRAVWEQVGELDPRFRVGMFEDDDYSLRIHHAGLRVVTAEDCFIHHFGGGSFRQLPEERSSAIFNENRAMFEEKWKLRWQPDQMRPGVGPAESAHVFDPVSFFLEG